MKYSAISMRGGNAPDRSNVIHRAVMAALSRGMEIVGNYLSVSQSSKR